MATQRQAEANRSNAQSSTGPRTDAGKARSALNALQTGIYSESLVLPEEKPEDLRKLIAEYYVYHTPLTPAARNAVDNLIRAEWFARRFARIDTQILAHEIRTLSRPDPGNSTGQAFAYCRVSMQKVQQRITATDNLYHRNLRVFQLLQPEQVVEEPEPEPIPEPKADSGPQVPDSSPIPDSQPPIPNPAAAPAPDSSTAQPVETTTKTQEMGSFRKITPIAAPNGHPALEDCPNCRNLGYLSPNCHYQVPGETRS